MTLYRLFNIHRTEQDRKEDCRDAMEKLADKPGFCLPDARFEIEKIRVKGGNPNQPAVCSLTHEYYDGVYDYVTRIGVYATRRKAIQKWLRVRKGRRFRDHPTGFYLNCETVGLISPFWEEGFTGWDE